MLENKDYLSKQIITYLGNKRSLLDFLDSAILGVKKELKKDKISFLDMFSGSGIVSRYAKKHSNFIISNDLELYSKVINECYLTNQTNEILKKIDLFYDDLCVLIKQYFDDDIGFIHKLYAPKDENNITKNDRVFYTKYNAKFIDVARFCIDKIDKDYQKFFLAPLLSSASINANTSGVFKGFYKNESGIGQYGGSGKNALSRIKADIVLQKPIFSNFNSDFCVYNEDANKLAKELDMVDVAYLDPPYNEHPYGSNYFMLNLIVKNEEPKEISKVSGIEKGWNKSVYNSKKTAKDSFFELVGSLKARFVLISYNQDGFISKEEFVKGLSCFGKLDILEQKYNTFRASRNLQKSGTYTKEYLFILQKNI